MSTPDLDFLRDVAVPAARSRSAGEVVTPPEFGTDSQVVTVGGQLCEFTEAVEPGLREDLSNCLLLAQLAADKSAGNPASDVNRWQDAYIETLQRSGWRLSDVNFKEQAISADGVFVHQEIIPLIQAFLGPAAAAGTLVIQLLTSLSEMQQDQPWITLFQSESQTLSGAKFQITLVNKNSNGESEVSTLAVTCEATSRIVQVLFFRLNRQSTKLRNAESTMTISSGNLAKIRDVIRNRVQEHVFDFVKNVPI